MHLFGRDLDREVAVVAEIGVNHEGDADVARRLIDLAADAGADAVKLQSYTPERFASASDPQRLARVTRFALSEEVQLRLHQHAQERGIPLFSSAITEDVVPFLASWCPAIKIASGDLDFQPVIVAAAETGLPVMISTGVGEVAEIDRAVNWFRATVGADLLRDRLILMHCVSAYPTPLDQANVAAVPFLRERYGLRVGYSNHVIEPEATLAAVALGAQVVEVHFTDQRHGREFRDHALSFEPQELRALMDGVARVRTSLGQHGKGRQACELAPEIIRKGVVAARDLPAGTVLARHDLMFARPATEFSALDVEALVGRKLLEPLARGETVARRQLG
jgi:N,N'-diacetyllegionaminate synthase